MPDYLIVAKGPVSKRLAHPIGETGFSFRESERPDSALTSWICAETIPQTARAVLQTKEQFEGLTGLIRVATETDVFGRFRAGWILARTARGLTSIVVRDAHHCSAKGLLDDAAFCLRQAERYCAPSAVVLVQQSQTDSGRTAREALERAFTTSYVQPDVMYESRLLSDIPLWFACLCPIVR